MLERLRTKGIEIVKITLHVGIGTFVPVRTDNPADHILKPERFEMTAAAAAQLKRRAPHYRSGNDDNPDIGILFQRYGRFEASVEADIFILPGLRNSGQLVQCSPTPSNPLDLLMLVSAFVSREKILSHTTTPSSSAIALQLRRLHAHWLILP